MGHYIPCLSSHVQPISRELTGHECLSRKAPTSLVFSAADLASPIAFSFVVPACFPIVNIRGIAKVLVDVCSPSASFVFSVTCSPVSIAEASPWPTDLLTYRPRV